MVKKEPSKMVKKELSLEEKDYLCFYNEQRVHQSLDYCTPAEVYFANRRKENYYGRL